MGRASDDTREQAIAVLRTGLLDGRLGMETFVERVDAAYRAKTHDELAQVTRDLPGVRRVWRELVDRLVARLEYTTLTAPIELSPPDMADGERRVIGRARSCDYPIADQTVSSRHAELVRRADGWLIRDLGSRNGTYVNGWRVTEQRLRVGDTVTLGTTVFVFQLPE